MDQSEKDLADVLAANAYFYEAFERRDLDGVSDSWEHSDRVYCAHPGWSALHGWGSVSSSWYALLTNRQRLQFIVTNEHANVNGDGAWVACDENILDDAESITVAALNVFVRSAGAPHGWLLVAHSGSVVYARADAS